MQENLSLDQLPAVPPFSLVVSTSRVRFDTSVLFLLFRQRELDSPACRFSLFYTMIYALRGPPFRRWMILSTAKIHKMGGNNPLPTIITRYRWYICITRMEYISM